MAGSGSWLLKSFIKLFFVDVIKKEFSKDWKGCTLKEIYYAGDDKALFTSYAKQYQGEEAIVLKTNFHTNYFAWKIGLNSNCDYEDYQWIWWIWIKLFPKK